MRVDSVVLLLVVGLICCTVNCYQPKQGAQDIPARCRQASVTSVSCRQHTPDNLLPHPDDCELFYYCVSPDAQPVCRQCPAGLHFSPRLHVCDHPEAASCRRPRPTHLPPSPTSDTTAAPKRTNATETATTGEEHVSYTTDWDYFWETATTEATASGSWWWWD